MDVLEYIRDEIRHSGYLSSLKIITKLVKYDSKISRENVDNILNSIECKDIHKIEYTNSYVASYRLKDLYYYNPKKKKRTTKRRQTKKKTK